MSRLPDHRRVMVTLYRDVGFIELSLPASSVLLMLTIRWGGPSGLFQAAGRELEIDIEIRAKVPREQIDQVLEELEKTGWLRRDGTVCWLIRQMEFTGGYNARNRPHRKSLQRHVHSLPGIPLIQDFIAANLPFFPDDEWPIRINRGPAGGTSRGDLPTENDETTGDLQGGPAGGTSPGDLPGGPAGGTSPPKTAKRQGTSPRTSPEKPGKRQGTSQGDLGGGRYKRGKERRREEERGEKRSAREEPQQSGTNSRRGSAAGADLPHPGDRMAASELLEAWASDPDRTFPVRESDRKTQRSWARQICDNHTREEVMTAVVGIKQLYPYSRGEPWDLRDLHYKFTKALESAANHPEVRSSRFRRDFLRANQS